MRHQHSYSLPLRCLSWSRSRAAKMKFAIQFEKECGHECLLGRWGLEDLPPGLIPLELFCRLYRQAMPGHRHLIIAKFNILGSTVPQVRLLIVNCGGPAHCVAAKSVSSRAGFAQSQDYAARSPTTSLEGAVSRPAAFGTLIWKAAVEPIMGAGKLPAPLGRLESSAKYCSALEKMSIVFPFFPTFFPFGQP